MLQNELYGSPVIAEKVAAKGMAVVLNPSPADDSIRKYPLEKVSCFILHQRLPIHHVLCYTLAHEGYGLLS